MDNKIDSNPEVIEVVSVYPLSEKEIEEIKKTFFLNKEVILKNIIDESIIGGIVIRYKSNIIDGSVVNYLNKVKKNL